MPSGPTRTRWAAAWTFERGAAVYGVPLAAVEKVVMVTETLTLEDRSALEVGGRSLPVADFAELIGAVAPPLGERPPALVIALGARRAVVTCDALLGEEEVVVKPLGPLLASVELFDVFSGGEGKNFGAEKKSLAYALTYRDKTRTLTNDEITVVHAKVRERLQRELGVELRE